MKKLLKFFVLVAVMVIVSASAGVASAQFTVPTGVGGPSGGYGPGQGGQPYDACVEQLDYNVVNSGNSYNRYNTNLGYILCKIGIIINSVIPILIALGVVYFIWGVISYAIAKDDEAKTAGRSAMIMGLIALLVIVSIWGLVNILKSTLGLNNSSTEIDVTCIEAPGVYCY